jgi:hypothetical protein
MIGANRPRTLIASARRVTLDRIQKVGKPWQDALWDIYRNLGPVHYGMGFKRSAAQRVNYFAAEMTEETDEPIPTEDERVIEAVKRLGDLGEIVGNFVIQENVAGEGYLYGKDAAEEQVDDEEWEVLSTIEVKERQGSGKNEITPEDYLLRIWYADPEHRDDPDSPLQSVSAQCEQLLLLNDQIGATARSRVPAGLLLLPDELSFPLPAEDAPDTGANADNDPFMGEIIEIITTAIADADSAARVAPNVIRGPAELLKEVRMIDFARDMDEVFANMREELLRQIAGGINLRS